MRGHTLRLGASHGVRAPPSSAPAAAAAASATAAAASTAASGVVTGMVAVHGGATFKPAGTSAAAGGAGPAGSTSGSASSAGRPASGSAPSSAPAASTAAAGRRRRHARTVATLKTTPRYSLICIQDWHIICITTTTLHWRALAPHPRNCRSLLIASSWQLQSFSLTLITREPIKSIHRTQAPPPSPSAATAAATAAAAAATAIADWCTDV